MRSPLPVGSSFMFQRALICTDFSDGLHRLVNFVPSLAGSGIKQVTFLHVVPLSDNREIPRIDGKEVEQARDRLSAALEQVPEGMEVQIEVQQGRPIDRIIDAIKAHRSDVVLLGTPSRSFLTEKLFGSTMIGLCQRISVPVLILRPQLISTYTVEELDLRCQHLFRYFLVPYDGSKPAEYAVEQIKRYAQNRAPHSLEQCLVCWVEEDVGRRGIPKGFHAPQIEEKLEQVKTDLEALGLTVEAKILHGNPIAEILTAAQDYDISAIASASGSVGKLIEWSIPSFTGELMRRSWHPILYFPPGNG